MNKILILHGWDSTSASNWFPWLKREGARMWYEVIVPDLPEAEAPVLADWLSEAHRQADELWEWDVIIGHSMWGKTAAHFIAKYAVSWVKTILVWPSYETIEDELDLWDPDEIKSKLIKFHESKLDFEKLNSLDNEYTVFLSDNDKYINPESATKYYSQLKDIKIIPFHGAGHFMKSEWFEKLPEILKYIKK